MKYEEKFLGELSNLFKGERKSRCKKASKKPGFLRYCTSYKQCCDQKFCITQNNNQLH